MTHAHTSKSLLGKLTLGAIGAGLMLASATTQAEESAGWSYKEIADSLHMIMESDRTVYTKLIVNRLQNKEKVIKASEHWEDDKALVLPAQMFRYGSEMVQEKGAGFTYALLSEWPINSQNAAVTDVEKEGLAAIGKSKKPYYAEETLGGKKYFTAVYPDKAVAPACITCHNAHKDSPRTDFKMGEVMGGVVLRLPMK